MLIGDTLWWGCPLPKSLRVLSLDSRKQAIDDEEVLRLCKMLRKLPALEYLDLKSRQLSHEDALQKLLHAVHRGALTHLALSHCCLEDFPEGCRLPKSLEVVDLSHNSELLLEEWLPEMAALPRCRAIRITSSGEDWDHSGDAAVEACLDAAPALEYLYCDDIEDVETLAEAREARGLAPITLDGDDDVDLSEVWEGFRAGLDTPAISYEACTLLPDPQLDPNPSSIEWTEEDWFGD